MKAQQKNLNFFLIPKALATQSKIEKYGYTQQKEVFKKAE